MTRIIFFMQCFFPSRRQVWCWLVFCSLGMAGAMAQSVRWEPAGGRLARGQVSTLELVFENCAPGAGVTPPEVQGVSFGNPSESRSSTFSFSAAEGERRSERVILRYPVTLTAEAPVTIPSFKVSTNAGEIAVASVSFEVGEATVGPGVALSEVANGELELPARTVWEGEVFPVKYRVSLQGQVRPRLTGNPEWDSSPLLVEGLEAPVRPALAEVEAKGEKYIMATYPLQACVGQPGLVRVNPVRQDVGLLVERDLYGRAVYGRFTVETAAAELMVRERPPAPEGFCGAVGKFSLRSSVVPALVRVDEPITWTVELDGRGNWPLVRGLPQRGVSPDFEVVQGQAKKILAEKKKFEGKLAEDVVLIPTKAGRYAIGPVQVVVFDPEAGEYVTLTSETVEVEVLERLGGGAGTGQVPAEGGGNAELPGRVPELPASVPGDPVSAEAKETVLLGAPVLLWRTVACAVWPLALWMGLAGWLARKTEPWRVRREAHRRMRRILQRLRAGVTGRALADVRGCLREWQRETATLWRLTGRAPVAAELPDAQWASLWAETERVLYREHTELSEEWLRRAEEMWRKIRFPLWNPLRALSPRNLFPFFAFLLLAVASPQILRAAEENAQATPAQAYAAGDFTVAEDGWREQVAARPTDWAARHNLSLALAQQKRWEESAAEAVVALLHQPQNEAVRRQARLTLHQAGYTPERLGNLIAEKPLIAWAGGHAPREWQDFLWQSALVFAAGWVVGLLAVYRKRKKWWGWLGVAISMVALLNMVLSFVALWIYGDWLQPDAAVVARSGKLYSVPTEAASAQETAPLTAGTLARIEGEYLGWRKVSFANKETGWVRAEELVPVWWTETREE